MDKCDTCDEEFTKSDGKRGDGNNDSLMINDYLMMDAWYKNEKPDWFKIKYPNPFSCRKCIKLLVSAGLRGYVGGDVEIFLSGQP